jgi:hypothetical protein
MKIGIFKHYQHFWKMKHYYDQIKKVLLLFKSWLIIANSRFV